MVGLFRNQKKGHAQGRIQGEKEQGQQNIKQ